MKFRAHETFFIRKGWLSKGIKNIEKSPMLFSDRSINPMDILGIGANMVKSLRYWLQAVGLTEEIRAKKRKQVFTQIGEIILREDPYIEELGTLWLLQYELCKAEELATSWFYFFNEFPLNEFTKEDFVLGISNFVKLKGEEVPSRSIEDDFNCIVNTYIPRYKLNAQKIRPEDNMDCPFGELGLLDLQNGKKKVYRKTVPLKDSISPIILLACILAQADDAREISLQSILHGKGSVGKIFNLDVITLMDILGQAELQGYIRIVRTAGLDVIRISKENMKALDFVEEYYKSLRQ